MDTTETYIKMCEKAEEIQEGHNFKNGDFWTTHKRNLIFSFTPEELTGDFLNPEIWYAGKHEAGLTINPLMTWLPRQDQLQEMVITHADDVFVRGSLTHFGEKSRPKGAKRYPRRVSTLLAMARDFCGDEFTNHFRNYTSMEQLWLAFVRKEKYNKVWNGEEWVK